MSGLNLFKRGTNIDIVRQFSNELSLLGRENGVDIMYQTVFKDKMFYVYPSEDPETYEFVYILSGEIEYEGNGEKQILKAHDYFTVKGLKSPEFFKAKTDVTYLWIITEPTFHQLSEDHRNLNDLIKKVESRDRYTFNHSERVAVYSMKVAKKLKLDTATANKLNRAAELHDIGKINVPVEILNKPGKLTKDEFDLIKKHPGDGADMVRKTSYSYLAEIIEQHHERIDGSGYPFGLKGNEITLEAKIIAVCDTYDAMTDDRAYRKALSPQFAIDELNRLSGIQYEPKVVQTFEEVLKEEGIIN
ncbi:HD domain-containing phosphohydrolase [Cytobacillus sp. Hz8]|uniref:HD domain-containing phosphohydrolase n=1 Tax=Cytobacillus sp. Hz8 TaxID=3347168 RepID=UPI0035E1BC6F